MKNLPTRPPRNRDELNTFFNSLTHAYMENDKDIPKNSTYPISIPKKHKKIDRRNLQVQRNLQPQYRRDDIRTTDNSKTKHSQKAVFTSNSFFNINFYSERHTHKHTHVHSERNTNTQYINYGQMNEEDDENDFFHAIKKMLPVIKLFLIGFIALLVIPRVFDLVKYLIDYFIS